MFPFFRNLFKTSKCDYIPAEISPVFDKAPFLTPWYISDEKPIMFNNGKRIKWKYFEKIRGEYVGILTLRDSFNNLLGLVNAFNNIHPSSDGLYFVIWKTATYKETEEPNIKIDLYKISDFIPLKMSRKQMLDFNKTQKPYMFSKEPIASMEYAICSNLKEVQYSFPPEFKMFDSFIAVVDDKMLYGYDSWGSEGTTLMLEFSTQQDIIRHYPQDWFNKSNVDFGYQWITRAVRDNNGLIHGQGFRIGDFVLDDTGRELRDK